MTPTRPSEPAVNEAAERLRNVLVKRQLKTLGTGYEAVLDAALATERRNTVERIRAAVGVMRTPAGRDIGYVQIGEQQFRAILDEVAT